MEEHKLVRKKQKYLSEGHQVNLIAACTDLAKFYESQGNFNSAISEYNTIAAIYKEENKPIQYAEAVRAVGESYMGLQQFEKALEYQRIYLDVAKKEQNRLEEQRALATIGHTYLTWFFNRNGTISDKDKENLNLASKFFRKSLIVCESLNGIKRSEKEEMSARLFYNLGLVQENLGDCDKAVELVKKATIIYKQNDIYEQLYAAYNTMAGLYEKRGEINETIRFYNLAIDTAKKLEGKSRLICATLLSKSHVLNKLGDFHASKQVLTKAYKLQTLHQQDCQQIERTLRIVASLCYTEDNLVTCNDQMEMKKLYERMGDGACELKNYDKAIEYYKKMLQATKKCGLSGKDLATCFYSIAETYRDNNQLEEAIKYFEEEYEVIKDSLKDNLNSLSNIADCKEASGASFKDVQLVYERAIENCRKAKNLKEEKRMVNRCVDYLRRVNQHREAFEMESRSLLLDNGDEELSSSSDSEDVDDRENVGAAIDLSALTDVSDDSDLDTNSSPTKGNVGRRKHKNLTIKKNVKGETQLHLACIAGKLPVVRHLVEQGHPINVRDNCGWLPLHEACICGHLEIVKILLDKGASINDRGGTLCNGVTPLHDAATNGHLQVMELLLDRGASVGVKTDDGATPLHTLVKWYDLTQPEDGETVALYEKLVRRLSASLEKAGQQLRPFTENLSSSVHQFEKENLLGGSSTSSNKTTVGQLRRVIDLVDEDDDDDDVTGETTRDYKNIMDTLRNKPNGPTRSSLNSGFNVKRPALVEAGENNWDDWLEDDLVGVQAPKKRKRNPSWENSPNSSKATRSPNKRTSINANHDDEEIIETHSISPEANLISLQQTERIPRRWSSGSSSNRQRKSQTSLLDVGFSRNRTQSNTPSTIVSSQKLKKTLQTKVNFQRNESWVSDEISSSTNSPVLEKPQENISANPTLFVDVRIEGRLYRVPVMLSQLQTHTIKWLAEQASYRYARKECLKPTLELETKNGAILADEDLLSLLFPMGGMQADEVQGRVLKWDLPPLTQRYKEACGQLFTDVDETLSKLTEEVSDKLNLGHRGIRGKKLAPLCKAISHQTSIVELDLSGNYLTTDLLQVLCNTTLPTLKNLSKLNLSCTGIQGSHVMMLGDSSKSLSKMLDDLDISCNLLNDECFKSLLRVCRELALRKLNLSGCGFTRKLAELEIVDELASLECLDLSENFLEVDGVINLLTSTQPVKLKSLNISNNKNSFGVLSKVIDVFHSKSNFGEDFQLNYLGVSRCDVRDSELYNLLRLGLARLKMINLSYNKNLSGISMRRLLENASLKTINLIGCDSILTYLENVSLVNIQNTNCKLLKLSVDWELFSKECDVIISVYQTKFADVQITKMHKYLEISVG